MKFHLALRITGKALQPDELSKLLNMQPTRSQTTGQVFKSPSGKERVAKFGMWLLDAEDEGFSDLDAKIIEFANRLPKDSEVWKEVRAGNEVDFYCGFFMGESNDMLYLSSEAVLAIGSFGASITLDTYDTSGE